MESGVLSVTTAGHSPMPELCVDSLAIQMLYVRQAHSLVLERDIYGWTTSDVLEVKSGWTNADLLVGDLMTADILKMLELSVVSLGLLCLPSCFLLPYGTHSTLLSSDCNRQTGLLSTNVCNIMTCAVWCLLVK